MKYRAPQSFELRDLVIGSHGLRLGQIQLSLDDKERFYVNQICSRFIICVEPRQRLSVRNEEQ